MAEKLPEIVHQAAEEAERILLHNIKGPFHGLPRAAAWGYPEPYTRDLMISGLGMLASGNKTLISTVRRCLKVAAKNQSPHGHIPSLLHDPSNKGASDTTPLFLLMLAIYRKYTQQMDFLEEEANAALTWMTYQSPIDDVIVAQLPTSDWRDEQWVLGFGIFVNAVVYAYLKLFGLDQSANRLQSLISHFTNRYRPPEFSHYQEGLRLKDRPYFAFWSYKVYENVRFDLLGNSLAILSGLAKPTRAKKIIRWVEKECLSMREKGMLAVDVPPNFFPFIQPGDPDWIPRYEQYNRAGEYHNGGIWPFVTGFYIAALVKVGYFHLAQKRLTFLAELVKRAKNHEVAFGFNEYYKAQTGEPCGEDWQTWSAAMFLYAYQCVRNRYPLFFE